MLRNLIGEKSTPAQRLLKVLLVRVLLTVDAGGKHLDLVPFLHVSQICHYRRLCFFTRPEKYSSSLEVGQLGSREILYAVYKFIYIKVPGL